MSGNARNLTFSGKVSDYYANSNSRIELGEQRLDCRRFAGTGGPNHADNRQAHSIEIPAIGLRAFAIHSEAICE
jgi:hypothetical protein